MPEPGAGGSATGNPFLDVLIVAILIVVSGFFAASELSLITVKRHRLAQLSSEGNRAARAAERLVEDPSRFLATIQVALTFLGFLASAVGAVSFSGAVADLIRTVPWGPIQDASATIAFLLTTMLIALVTIVVGELAPKTLALSFTERFALFVARPIAFMERVLSPFVWLVTLVSGLLVRAAGGSEKPHAGYLSTEELKMLVETGSEQGGIEEDEKEMIHGVIELGERRVHEVMVPRIGIRAVDISDPMDDVLDVIIRAGHSRLPVYEDSLDNIIGILYAKDLLPYVKRNGRQAADIDIRKLVRPPVYVPESKAVDELLHEMQVTKRHIAIVVDEYGGTAGLITLEDVVEEIVGEIQDEYDSEESLVEPLSNDGEVSFRLDGRVSMDDVRDLFGLPDEEEEDEDAYDTLGGFIVHRVGRIPLPGATVRFRDVTLTVDAAEPRRVAKVIASRPNPEDEPGNDDGELNGEG
ncbi:MAG TPA: hemolysin family protein [Candidatus Limnocylindria bacterium]|jgi:putative hemolysin|nr:hemolysin family protein [Candidatus Limnocylindria bacterium]